MINNRRVRIGFDFDGVCTDLTFIQGRRISIHDYLYSPYSIILSKRRHGLFELVSVLGLFFDILIVTSRPDGDRPCIERWLKENDLDRYFDTIVCCGDNGKKETLTKNNISLLVDDSIEQITGFNAGRYGLLWNKQSWVDLALEIFEYLCPFPYIRDSSLCSTTTVKKIELFSDLGASPVFILTFLDGEKLKVRVCLTEEIRDKIVYFLNATQEEEFRHVAQLIDTNGLAIVKTYVYGKIISEFSVQERLKYIFKVGLALAKLHSFDVREPFPSYNVDLEDDLSLLVFSADNFNTLITYKGEVVFIDLEACNIGSRWSDYCWAENLLCQTPKENESLKNGYYSVYNGENVEPSKLNIANYNYKLWLTKQLQLSRLANCKDSEKIAQINEIIDSLWTLK